jgi:hypothetical protein
MQTPSLPYVDDEDVVLSDEVINNLMAAAPFGCVLCRFAAMEDLDEE